MKLMTPHPTQSNAGPGFPSRQCRPFSPTRFALAPGAALMLMCGWSAAFPPAPHHTLYGLTRNQWGDPLDQLPARVFLETSGGARVSAGVINFLDTGVNYELNVPMDAGTTADLYKPSALRPFFDFRLRVQIGNVSYLPIEMSGTLAQIGQPGQRTRVNLTLGVDSDQDGLPDAWEEAILALLGGTLADIRPEDDSDGDGISNLNEYLAGTYAFDPNDGFRIEAMQVAAEGATLSFLAIRGRTYRVQSTVDFRTWTEAWFQVLDQEPDPPLTGSYLAPDVRLLRVRVPGGGPETANRFYRALVQ